MEREGSRIYIQNYIEMRSKSKPGQASGSKDHSPTQAPNMTAKRASNWNLVQNGTAMVEPPAISRAMLLSISPSTHDLVPRNPASIRPTVFEHPRIVNKYEALSSNSYISSALGKLSSSSM